MERRRERRRRRRRRRTNPTRGGFSGSPPGTLNSGSHCTVLQLESRLSAPAGQGSGRPFPLASHSDCQGGLKRGVAAEERCCRCAAAAALLPPSPLRLPSRAGSPSRRQNKAVARMDEPDLLT